MPLHFSIISQEDGTANVALFLPGVNKPMHSSNPSYKIVVQGLLAGDESIDYVSLFNTEAVVRQRFERLSDRVSVTNGTVLIDGDPVDGTLEQQIIDFMQAGEDFKPLVNFYEKLLNNPLGDVKEGIFDWIKGQTAEGALTITPEGDILGYKGVHPTDDGGYRPSRQGAGIVNGVEVLPTEYIVQRPGDVVEMPRSKVLYEPSSACGTGLHIGTWAYAKSFGPETLLVKFSPADVVSLPDSNAVWKLRVCRYTVVKVVDEALSVPVWHGEHAEPQADFYGDVEYEPEFVLDDRVRDEDGDEGYVVDFTETGDPVVEYDNLAFGTLSVDAASLELIDDGVELDAMAPAVNTSSSLDFAATSSDGRNHGKGGRHSRRAEGRGRNAYQAPNTGQFVSGRPGSKRDGKGRFTV